MKPSIFAPESFPEMPPIPGVSVATTGAGVKYNNRDDVMLVHLTPGSTVAGVLTRSKTASAPVDWCRKYLPAGKARAIIVNAGNANAFTGRQGELDVKMTARHVARALGCSPKRVLIASTGVIGERLPVERISSVIPRLARSVSADNWQAAARAIMTTDTYPKGAFAKTEIFGQPVTIAGIAKGSGMIAPDMATMLSFVFTDAAITRGLLQAQLKKAVGRTFNCITVDSDTSTSDTVLLAATGKAAHQKVTDKKDLKAFQRALRRVLQDLATQVVKDGEGASKFITIEVTGAASSKAARVIALAIANSPLVKTAIAGEDANWGRIVMAVGKAGEKANRDRLSIAMNETMIVSNGCLKPDYDERLVTDHLKGSAIKIGVDVGVGKGRARVWTCDLTHDYITINADYRS